MPWSRARPTRHPVKRRALRTRHWGDPLPGNEFPGYHHGITSQGPTRCGVLRISRLLLLRRTEADATAFGLWWCHQRTDGVKDSFELRIVFFL